MVIVKYVKLTTKGGLTQILPMLHYCAASLRSCQTAFGGLLHRSNWLRRNFDILVQASST
jgi:hypothetical protein